jgi:DNA-binding MarR family transcriptional regulator
MQAPREFAADEEARRLRAVIRGLVRRFSLSERADVSCCGMTVAQAATLEALQVEGPMRMGELGRCLGIAPSTLSRNLERLEQRGLVAREPDPEDARAIRVRLGPGGTEAAREVEEQETRFAATILDGLDARRRSGLLDDLEGLLLAVRRATESCCPGAFDHLMTDFPREDSRVDPQERQP